MIKVLGLTKQYRDHKVLDNVNLHIPQGVIFGILGRNGVGKTTFIECLIGLREKNSGKVIVFDELIEGNSETIKKFVGVQPQEASLLPRQTVRETIDLFSSFYEKTMPVQQLIDLMNLSDLVDKQVRTLSKGQKQRLLISIALIGNPKLIILDEPTSGLDPQVRRLLWEIIRQLKENGVTILLTTHYMEEAEQLCDIVTILNNGSFVTQGSPAEIIREHTFSPNNRNLESAFLALTGTDIRGGID